MQGGFGTRQSLCDMSLEGQLRVQPKAQPLCRPLFDGKLFFSDADGYLFTCLKHFAPLAKNQDLRFADFEFDFVITPLIEYVLSDALEFLNSAVQLFAP